MVSGGWLPGLLWVLGLAALCLGVAVWVSRSPVILGRSKQRIVYSLPRAPLLLWNLVKVLMRVKQPFRFIRHYVTRTLVPDRTVEFRDGLKIHLSDSPDDLITVYVILIRDDYGTVPVGGVILDIGANIGVFSLQAVRHGARKVYAFEPNGESVALVRRNADDNGFSNKIETCNFAVAQHSGRQVKFPAKSDPSNTMGDNDGINDYESVETISLPEILTRFSLDRVDMLKLDCEGAEYEIVLNSPDWVWPRIAEVHIEYHQSRPESLIDHLKERGFRLEYMSRTTGDVGHLRLSQSGSGVMPTVARREPDGLAHASRGGSS